MADEPIEFLVSRRSKRTTAGNRMQAALAEMTAEEVEDGEDDNDFVIEKDEQDVFESDFESTDEEEDNGEAEEGRVHEEELRERRSARSKLDKATAAAHIRNKATFNPHAQASNPKPKPKARARIEEIADDLDEASSSAAPGESSNPLKRKSLRAHTVQNTSATVKRLKESEHHKALAPKKAKSEVKRYSQGDLIARALDNEEGNIIEHRDYLKIEEEKRRQARVVRATVKGPALRWISKVEEVEVVVPAPPAPAPPFPQHVQYYYNTHFPAGTYPVTATYNQIPHHAPYTQVQPYNSSFIAFQSWFPTPAPPSNHTSFPSTSYALQPPPAFTSTNPAPVPIRPPPPPPPPPLKPTEPEIRIEKVGKNYIIHELGQRDGIRRPTWNDSMHAMFGKQLKWDQIEVYNSKNRPFSRHTETCSITGKPGVYMDPRTGVAFADVYAYKVLTELLEHAYVWRPAIGLYTGNDNRGGGVEAEVC